MISDCVIDTNIFADILAQFNPSEPNNDIIETNFISKEMCKILNGLISYDGDLGLVVVSTFVFIEVANQFKIISRGRFDLARFNYFLIQPPAWFLIEPLSIETTKHYIGVPKQSKKAENIELTDAFHVATAIQRGPNTFLATTDGKLNNLSVPEIIIIN